MRSLGRIFVGLLMAGALTGTLLMSTSGVARAYGHGAAYQIELSANIGGRDGGGVWLWIELDPSGGGDYTGSDCGHGEGGVADKGEVTWTVSGDSVIISGVQLNGLGGFSTTITVPKDFGHYSGTVGTFLTLPAFIPPNIGNSQLQVAP
jgi:hypothetical protein